MRVHHLCYDLEPTCAYARERVEPCYIFIDSTVVDSAHKDKRLTQEPPNTCHLSILRNSRSFSMSLTKSHVVFSSVLAVLERMDIAVVLI